MAGLLGLALAPLAAEARPPGHGSGPHGGGFERALEAIDLDAEARAAVDAVLDGARDRGRELRREIRAERERMHELLAQPDADPSTLEAQADRIGALELAAHKARIATLLAVRAHLTPEQRAVLAERMGEGRGRSEGKRCR